MKINKDTKIYGSFAKTAGNNGCKMFNTAFHYYELNAIYKSFSINNISDAIDSMKILDIKGVGITMPFKKEVLKYIDIKSPEVLKIKTANTIVNTKCKLIAFNTDYMAAIDVLTKKYDEFLEYPRLYILGNGGYSAAVQQAAQDLNLKYEIIERKQWDKIKTLKYKVIFNCTPVLGSEIKIDKSNIFIDCDVNSSTGHELSLIQASYQFKLYTGLIFPIR